MQSSQILEALFFAVVFSMLFFAETQASVFGCNIAGQWKCYPSPEVCYREASHLSVKRFASYAMCKPVSQPAKRKK